MSSRPPAWGAEYSLGSSPTPSRKQPRLSAPPVTRAIWGMSPSERLAGRRVSDEPTMGVFAQALTVGKNVSRRHLPICTTRGIFVPAGTPVSEAAVGRGGRRRHVVADRHVAGAAGVRTLLDRRQRATRIVRNEDDDVVEGVRARRVVNRSAHARRAPLRDRTDQTGAGARARRCVASFGSEQAAAAGAAPATPVRARR